jgi:hypothetical protein
MFQNSVSLRLSLSLSLADVKKFKDRKFSYRGCFEDKSNRDLHVEVESSKSMTIERCYRHCKSRGFPYFGIQVGEQCFCGNSYGKWGHKLDTDCSMKCKGNSKQFCGEGWRNSVYYIKGIGE